ncbi:MAG: transposase [Prolixibacteraceae bacterium]|nr:transposase [Prolixibacteraceae bacterium]
MDCQEEGRPPYHPSLLLKLYLYGYRDGIRTSRKLEREAQTNMEAMWLLAGLRPKYKTIADSRKNNLNEKKLKQHLSYIDSQISEYQAQMDGIKEQLHYGNNRNIASLKEKALIIF